MEPDHVTGWDVTDFIEGEQEPGRLEWVWDHVDRCEEWCVHWVAMMLTEDGPPTAEELALKEIGEQNPRERFEDLDDIRWVDQNLLLVIRKAEICAGGMSPPSLEVQYPETGLTSERVRATTEGEPQECFLGRHGEEAHEPRSPNPSDRTRHV